jgi:GT2 family glycosyltransferase
MSETPETLPPPYVTAVLVSHDGAAWLPEALAALAAQDRAPQSVVAVDTGSTDGSVDLLVAALGAEGVVRLSRRSGWGSAVRAGLEAAPRPPRDAGPDEGTAAGPAGEPAGEPAGAQEWIWLLHDDCAPDPDALTALLAEAAISPSAGVIGPKTVGWDDPRHLVEVGIALDGAGRRWTGLESGEIDQGQWDAPRDVLAVGTAGALVRRDVWVDLDGFDRRLPLLHDDVDFGWRANLAGFRVLVAPRARVRHARALLTGHRRASAARGTRMRSRRHGVYVRLANASLPGLLWQFPVLAGGAVLRALGLLLTRRPRAARDELLATVAALCSLATLVAARHWRAHLRRVPGRVIRPLLPPPGAGLRAGVSALGDRVGGTPPPPASSGAFETGPGENADDLPPASSGVSLGRALTRPGALLVLVLAAVGLVAERHLIGPGPLAGGRLLTPPGSASALWSAWLSSWHVTGLGSSDPSAPWTPWLAAAGTVLGGSAALAVTLLFLLALPLAGLSAYLSARVLRVGPGVRALAALTYALLGGLPQAVAGGRFDVVVAIVAIPPLLAAGTRLLSEDPARVGWRRAFALGLGLAISVSFAPQLAPVAAALLVAGALGVALAGRPGAGRRALSALVALAVPVALLAPFTRQVAAHPLLLLTGLGSRGGVAGTTVPPLRAIDLLLLHPGGAPLSPWTAGLAAPLMLIALIGLLRDRRGTALAGIGIALAGWAAAVLEGRVATPPGHASPAVGIGVAAAGVLAAALIAGDRARASLAGHRFGPRQPLAVFTAGAVLLAPVLAAGLLVVRGDTGALRRQPPPAVPGFVVSEDALDPGSRVLVLSGDSAEHPTVGYWAGPAAGPVLGDEDLESPPAVLRLLHAVVRDLAAPLGTDAGQALATLNVGYVVAPAPVSPLLAAALDDQPALSRLTTPQGGLWQVTVPGARAELLSGALAALARHPAPPGAATGRGPTPALLAADPPRRLSAGLVGVSATIPPGPQARLAVLADAADGGWRATLGGIPLQSARAWGWSQAYLVPATTTVAHLVISHPEAGMGRVRGAQVAGLALLLILAAPAPRRPHSEALL